MKTSHYDDVHLCNHIGSYNTFKIKCQTPSKYHVPLKRTKHLKATEETKIFVGNVAIKLRSKKTTNNTTLCDCIASLFSSMQQVNKTLTILTLIDDNLPLTLSSTAITSKETAFFYYFSPLLIHTHFTKLHLYLQSNVKIVNIKLNSFV